VHTAAGIPQSVKSLDLFGMGYPYYICLYDRLITCSSDYGVLLF